MEAEKVILEARVESMSGKLCRCGQNREEDERSELSYAAMEEERDASPALPPTDQSYRTPEVESAPVMTLVPMILDIPEVVEVAQVGQFHTRF